MTIFEFVNMQIYSDTELDHIIADNLVHLYQYGFDVQELEIFTNTLENK